MPSRSTVITAACAGLAGLTLAGSTLAMVAIVAPGSPAAPASGLTSVHEARASARLTAPRPSAADLAIAERETRRSLETSVATPIAWLRLAYIDHARSGGLTDRARVDLDRSYTLAPYGPDDTPWRLGFVFDNWRVAGPELRRQAMDEIRVTRAHNRNALRDLPDRVADPDGHMAATLAVGGFNRR